MRETDFKELMIARPPTRDEEKQSILKHIFVKASSRSTTLHLDDLWKRIQRQSQMHRDGTKFILRQFLRENVAQTRNFVRMQNTLRGMKNEQSSVKQELNKQREVAESYKKELLVAREKISEKDRQLAHFRKIFESRTPQSPSSIVSGGSRGRRSIGSSGQESSLLLGHDRYIAPRRPRRVSDQYDRGTTTTGVENLQRSSSGQHDYRRAGQYTPPNPYEQQVGNRTSGSIIPPPPINPYNKRSSEALSQQSPNRPVPNNNNFAVRNPYQKTMGPSAPYHSHPSDSTGHHSGAMTLSQPPLHRQRYSTGSSGESVSSRRSNGSGGSGGRIRNITAATGYFFSGGAPAPSADAGRKRPLSPGGAFAGNRGSGSNRPNSCYRQQHRASGGPPSYHQQRRYQDEQPQFLPRSRSQSQSGERDGYRR